MTDFVVGSPVRDEDFCYRELFIDELWEALDKHNALLCAPRRTGKTSVMYRLLDHPKSDWLVIHLNVEALKTPSEFLINLVDALHEHQPEYLRNTLTATCSFLTNLFDRIKTIEAFELKVELRKSEELENAWGRVIRNAGYCSIEDGHALLELLLQILESEDTYPDVVRDSAFRRLNEIVFEIEPEGFDEESLNLPLSRRPMPLVV